LIQLPHIHDTFVVHGESNRAGVRRSSMNDPALVTLRVTIHEEPRESGPDVPFK
jgi:hypothetical protein